MDHKILTSSRTLLWDEHSHQQLNRRILENTGIEVPNYEFKYLHHYNLPFHLPAAAFTPTKPKNGGKPFTPI